MKIRLDKKRVFILIFMMYIGITSFFSVKKLLVYYIEHKQLDSNNSDKEVKDSLEQDLAAEFYNKISYVELNGEIKKILGQRQMNGVVKLDNNYLTIVSGEDNIESQLYKNINENVDYLSDLKEYLNNYNTKLLCVVVPGTVCKYNTQLPVGIEDYTNSQLDYYVDLLSKENIEYIDLREEIKNDAIDHYSLYYKTDHHWNIWGGLYASKKIVNKANQMLNDNVNEEELFDKDNFYVEKYDEWHLGSRGQRTGRFFAKPDDFEIIYPKFDTNITRCSDNLVGDFKDVFIRTKALNSKDYTSRYTYDTTYWYSVMDEFKNDNAISDKKIFLFSDSMGRVVTPNLSLAYKDVKASDSDYIKEDIKRKNISEFAPDLFVVLVYPGNISEPGYFDFGID